jgi:hypothetical protein
LSPEERVQRATHAQQLLGDKILQESLKALSDVYTMALRQCAAKDDIGRYRYAVALDVVDGVTRHLNAVLNDGKLAAKEAQEFQSRTPIEKIARIF